MPLKNNEVFYKSSLLVRSTDNWKTQEKKIADALMYNARNEVKAYYIKNHSICFSYLKSLTGYKSNDNEMFESYLENLRKYGFDFFDINKEIGFVESGRASFLSEYSLLKSVESGKRGGIKEVCYSFSNKVKELMSDLSKYIEVDFSVQSQFKSPVHIQAYQNGLDTIFKKTGFGQTIFLELKDARKFLNLKDNCYRNVGDFTKIIKRISKSIDNKANMVLEANFKKKVDNTKVKFKFFTKKNSNGKQKPKLKQEKENSIDDSLLGKKILALEKQNEGRFKEFNNETLKSMHKAFRTNEFLVQKVRLGKIDSFLKKNKIILKNI